MVEFSRRNAAQGVSWSAPVLAVAASAPLTKTVNLRWVSSRVSFSNTDNGSDVRMIRYTFTNEGPDEVPTQVKFDLRDIVTVDSADWSASANAAVSLVESTTGIDPDSGQVTYRFHIVVPSTQGVANGDELWANVQVSYGCLGGASSDLGHPEQIGECRDPQTVLDSPTCVTSTLDDGTTWGYLDE